MRPGPHTFAALFGLVAIATLGVANLREQRASLILLNGADIGVEIAASTTIELDYSLLRGNAIIDIGYIEYSPLPAGEGQGEGPPRIFVSVPDAWIRREVRGAPLEAIQDESRTFGFRRFSMPRGATVSFRADVAPETITLHNPTDIPLMVRLSHVDLEKDAFFRDVVLVQGASRTLW